MLTLNTKLDSGTLCIVSETGSKGVAATNLTAGHEAELSELKAFLRRNVSFSCVLYLDRMQVGTWKV